MAEWWDVVLFAILAALHILAWREYRRPTQGDTTSDEASRRTGGQMITASSAAGLTAVSILVSATAVIVQQWTTSLPVEILTQASRAAFWFLLSLVLGLWVVFLVPLRSPAQDVQKSAEIGIPFGLQLISLFIGVARLVWGIYEFVSAKGG